jgi:hypothetical protein
MYGGGEEHPLEIYSLSEVEMFKTYTAPSTVRN